MFASSHAAASRTSRLVLHRALDPFTLARRIGVLSTRMRVDVIADLMASIVSRAQVVLARNDDIASDRQVKRPVPAECGLAFNMTAVNPGSFMNKIITYFLI